ncbi:MAG: thioesterase family protein [Gemmatimonadota bacterium]|nr:thioesterase family protein [Gemmatimonadota bacterium]
MARFRVLDRVRWSDCDPLGIIHYSTYLRLFEIAEHEMFRACGLPYETLRKAGGVWLPRKALRAEFHSPAQMDEPLEIETWFSRVGDTSLTMRFEVYREGDRAHRASGSLAVVCVHKDTMAKFPIPAEVREKIAEFVEPD